ncbi:MAG: adenosylhomocysteinase [Candidatus Micrarchaeota archaeon]|nr:adenosylhomocysteinase [Candidatus Micrarchaeota archaeon]
MQNHDIANLRLAGEGAAKIYLAERQMPVLTNLRATYSKSKFLKGLTIGMCMHITKETAVLCRTLLAAGAKVALCASNPLSTQDDVAAALVKDGIHVYGKKGETIGEYKRHLRAVAMHRPNIILDDGGDLTVEMLQNHKEKLGLVIGGCEETTTGVIRLKAMERDNVLRYPVIAVNDNNTKRLIDNYYGTGQSTIDGILRATNILLAGKSFVVCGYGPCGKGLSLRAKGMGANVIVCEVNPFNALQAHLDGFRVMPIEEAARIGDIFVTVTGNTHVITYEHMLTMKDGAVLANSGHFDVEIDVEALNKKAKARKKVRQHLDEYLLVNGRRVYVCGEGRLVNLAAAEGHPSEVMATSFLGQCFAIEYLVENMGKLPAKVIRLPEEYDLKIARLQLEAFGIKHDKMTEEQEKYVKSWK